MRTLRLVLLLLVGIALAHDLVRYLLLEFSLSLGSAAAFRMAQTLPGVDSEDLTSTAYRLAESRLNAAALELARSALPSWYSDPTARFFRAARPDGLSLKDALSTRESAFEFEATLRPLLLGGANIRLHRRYESTIPFIRERRPSKDIDCHGIPKGAPGFRQLACGCAELGRYALPRDGSCVCFVDHDRDGECSCPPPRQFNLNRTACVN